MKNALLIFHLIICVLTVLFVPDKYENSIFIGILALIYSLLTVFLVREKKELMILFSVIFYINLSSFVLGPLTRGLLFNAYQHELWSSKFDTIGMKCVLLSACMFYIVLKINIKKTDRYKQRIKYSYGQNTLISTILLLAVLIICLFGYGGSAIDGEYVSNQNPLFEYAIFLMVLAWYYGGREFFIKILWILCSSYYIFLGVMAGDRSSAFMLLMLIVLYKLHDVGALKIVTLFLLGIFAANTIALFRTGALANSSGIWLYAQGLKSFFSDTAAQSYYTGITIIYYMERSADSLSVFYNWVLSLLTGSLFVDRKTVEFSMLSRDFYANGGGGLFQSYFYAFYGYIGVSLGSVIVSYIIYKVYYSWNNTFSLLLRFVIPVLSFRWYLYNPTSLFRACLLNFFIIYIFTRLLDGFMNYFFQKK